MVTTVYEAQRSRVADAMMRRQIVSKLVPDRKVFWPEVSTGFAKVSLRSIC
jgi:hypothetical protein